MHMNTCTHAHTHTLTRSHTHAYAITHTHAHALTHTLRKYETNTRFSVTGGEKFLGNNCIHTYLLLSSAHQRLLFKDVTSHSA